MSERQIIPNKITCGGVDISDHVAAMFDALVHSMDWGSGFLCDDQIEAIMTVGALAGWDMSGAEPTLTMLKSIFTEQCPRPPTHPHDREASQKWHERDYLPWNERKQAAIRAWRDQFAAKARELISDSEMVYG